MLTPNNSHVPLPTIKEMMIGSADFARVLVKNPKTLIGMVRELVRTYTSNVPHASLNNDQYHYLEHGYVPKYIAVLVPGFQLDGTSLLAFKKSFNEQGIPAFFPGELPHGKEAVLFREHPEVLVERIVRYVQQIQKEYSETEILLVGHSYGGAQVLHAAHRLEPSGGKVIPITVAGVLGNVGPMAQAIHAVKYRIPSHIFSGKDAFINEARTIQSGGKGLTVVDTNDGYLPKHVQAGVYADDVSHQNLVVSDIKSPGHYRQGVDSYFSRYITDRVLKRLKERK